MNYNLESCLNDEVEVIEENKEIEELNKIKKTIRRTGNRRYRYS